MFKGIHRSIPTAIAELREIVDSYRSEYEEDEGHGSVDVYDTSDDESDDSSTDTNHTSHPSQRQKALANGMPMTAAHSSMFEGTEDSEEEDNVNSSRTADTEEHLSTRVKPGGDSPKSAVLNKPFRYVEIRRRRRNKRNTKTPNKSKAQQSTITKQSLR